MIEWTMFQEMQMTELCFSFFTFFFVLSLVPFFLMLIIKSEIKQAKYGRFREQIK